MNIIAWGPQVSCPDAASLDDSCKLTSKSGSYNSYTCSSPYCQVDISSGRKDSANCTAELCSIKDTSSEDSILTCGGKGCSVAVEKGKENLYFVMPKVPF